MAGYRPLTGLRVVDMVDEKAELCGRLLADLGADVVRIEPPTGAVSRTLPPLVGDESLYFEVRNANKRSAVLDLSHPEGREALVDLLGDADLWIETSRPGTLAAWGLDPRVMADRLRRLVVVSVTDFGQTGPYRDFVATDAVMEAMAWMLFRAGVVALPPVLPPGAIAYDLAGVSAAFAALTALIDRAATGLGQHVDVSVMEAVAQTTDWGLTSYTVIRKMGMYGEVRDGGGKVYPVIPCQDGYVRPAMVSLAEWKKIRDWIGEAGVSPDIVQQELWDDQRTRLELFDELLRPAFIEFFRDKTMKDASAAGQDRGIPITPMLPPGEVLAAEQFEALGSFVDDETAGGTPGRFASGFYVVDGERIGRRSPAPVPAPPAPVPAPPAPWREPAFTSRRGGEQEPGAPYRGLRVVEFGSAGAVPEMGRLLAEYGADVIRIESPSRPDVFRQLGGPGGMGGPFASSNRTTRSLGVDYTSAAGRAVVEDLIARADVVLENLPPGTLERHGLGPDRLRALQPAALVVSSQTMGRRGPWSHWRGYGSQTQLPGGMSWLWSFPGLDEPVTQNVAFPDHLVGRLGAVVIAADVVGRQRSGAAAGAATGAHVEIVQAEMALNLLADLLVEESITPGSVQPQGNRSRRGAPWGVYRCQGDERWCVISCRHDADWQALVGAMGRPAWALDAALASVDGRRAAHDAIDDGISAWTGARTDRQVMAELQAAGVPAGMMMYVSDVPEDPHLRARGYVLEIDQPGLGPVLLEGPAFHASRLPGPRTLPAPLLGQDTRAVCTGVLGYDPARVEALLADGVLVAPAG